MDLDHSFLDGPVKVEYNCANYIGILVQPDPAEQVYLLKITAKQDLDGENIPPELKSMYLYESNGNWYALRPVRVELNQD